VSRLADEVVFRSWHRACARHGDGAATSIPDPCSPNGMDRVPADYMGMLGTVIKRDAVQDCRAEGIETRVMNGDPHGRDRGAVPSVAGRSAPREGAVTIFAAGTGQPRTSRPTPPPYCARSRSGDVIIKATSVDGVFRGPERIRMRSCYEEISSARDDGRVKVIDRRRSRSA